MITFKKKNRKAKKKNLKKIEKQKNDKKRRERERERETWKTAEVGVTKEKEDWTPPEESEERAV